jgi:hypothetical protein
MKRKEDSEDEERGIKNESDGNGMEMPIMDKAPEQLEHRQDRRRDAL